MERANAENLKNRLGVLAELYTCDKVFLSSDFLGKENRNNFEMLCQVFDKGFIEATNFYYYMADAQVLQKAEEILRSGAVKHNYPLGEQLSKRVALARENLEKYPHGAFAEVGKLKKEALINETEYRRSGDLRSDFGSLIKSLYAASLCYTDICNGQCTFFDYNDNNYLYFIRYMAEHRLSTDRLFRAGLKTINEYGLGNSFAVETKKYIQKKQKQFGLEEKRRKIEEKKLEIMNKRRKKMAIRDTQVQDKNAVKLAVEAKDEIKMVSPEHFSINGDFSTKSFLRAFGTQVKTHVKSWFSPKK